MRSFTAARSRVLWATTASLSVLGALAVVLLALRHGSWYFFGLCACTAPTLAVAGFWRFDRRVLKVEARELTLCAEFISQQLENVQVTSPAEEHASNDARTAPRPRRAKKAAIASLAAAAAAVGFVMTRPRRDDGT